MKSLTLWLILGGLALLTACMQEDTLLPASEAAPSTAVDFREDCTDYSDCSALAGALPMSFEFGPGSAPDNYVDSGGPAGFCSDPTNPPLVFKVIVNVERTGREVLVIRHLGVVQSLTGEICFRPYVQDNEVFPDPIPQQFPPELYPICGEISADYVATNLQGEELWLSLEFASRPDPEDVLTYIAEGQWTITGGTGRFEGATGGGCMNGYGPANFLAPNSGVDDVWFMTGGIDY